MNIDYAIHRYGEWIMLMLGESVLSLLIVGVKERDDFYKTFYCGIISIALLENLHFRSQPHHVRCFASVAARYCCDQFVLLVGWYADIILSCDPG